MIKVSRVCFIVLFATLGGTFLVMMTSSVAGFLNGDHRNHTIGGSPSLDSLSMPYWVHWPHVVMYYAVPVMVVSFVLGVLTLVLSTMLPKNP